MLKTCSPCGHLNPNFKGGHNEACPACGTIYAPAPFTFAQPGEPNGATLPSGNTAPAPTARQKITTAIAVAILVLGLVAMCTQKSTPPTFGEAAAFGLCRDAIRAVSKDPDKAEIPVINNASPGGTEFYFAWGQSTQQLRLRNGLGIDVPASASCVVNAASRSVTSLSLNDKTLIGT